MSDAYAPDPFDDEFDLPQVPEAFGAVLEAGRGSLPFALIHGEALVSCAAWALGDAQITPVDHGVEWAGLKEADEPLVLHDPLCPMTPAWFLARCLNASVERTAVVVGVRPVTDTVKRVEDRAKGAGQLVGETVDRDGLLAVASPIVLPAAVVAALDGLPTTDFAELAAWLSQRFPVVTLEAPPEARRVADADDIALLEALTAPERRSPLS